MRNSPVDTKVSEGMERGASGTAAEIALLPTQRPWWSRGGGRSSIQELRWTDHSPHPPVLLGGRR